MKIGILIGRFQVPEPHEGHRFLIKRILERVDELVILVGSSNQARSPRNPYTFLERREAIYNSFKDIKSRILVVPINDYMYNDSQWMADVAATIKHCVGVNQETILYGHFKPGNDYLKWFPQLKYENIDNEIDVSGTEMRNANRHLLPLSVQEDMRYIEKEAKKFENYPYPDSLNVMCGDAVVECLGHVLLVKRGRAPGVGNWALPGGHKHTYETALRCVLRELDEETNLRIPEKVLVGSIVDSQLFDHPGRSVGLPKMTYAVHFRVQPNPDGSFPRTKAGDDASEYRWVPIAEAVNTLRLHDDHASIISEFTGVQPLMAIHNPSITND